MGILIVCTGNTCRSPMAEWLLRHHLVETGLEVPVRSAGTLGWSGRGATDHAVAVLAERGVSVGPHVATRLHRDMVAEAELVIAMTRVHAGAVAAHDPGRWERTFLPGELVRLADLHGARHDGESIGEWADRLGRTRPAAKPIGRAHDEIADPAGQDLDTYRAVADRLERVVVRVSGLLAGVEGRRTGVS